MKIHVALIEHKYGSAIYAAKTYEGLMKLVYEYVREWWNHEIPNQPMPEDEKEAIDTYFEKVENEWLTTDETELGE